MEISAEISVETSAEISAERLEIERPLKGEIVLVEAPTALDRPAGKSPERRGPDPIAVFLTGYPSENSRRAMLSSLRTVAKVIAGVADERAVPWETLRFEHVNALRAKLAGSQASTSVNRHLIAVRGLMKTHWRLGLIDREVLDRICDVATLRASRPESGRALGPEEIAGLFAACDDSPAGRRDAAILALTAGCGLRRAEVCLLDLASHDSRLNQVQVLGKGDKYRVVYPPPKSAERLRLWREVRGETPGPLVCTLDRTGKPRVEGRLSHRGVTVVLEAICKRAAISGFTPHDLRRTFITQLLEKGADPLVVSKLAGHANVQTTMRYDRRGEQTKRDAVSLLDY